MDPTTAYRLAQYRIDELHAEASAQRLATAARRNGRQLRPERPARGRRWLNRLALTMAALRSMAARREPDMPCR